MKKKDILIKKIKCPECNNEIELAVEVEVKLKLNKPFESTWVDIRGVVYVNPNQVNFSDVDNPLPPLNMHNVCCFEVSSGKEKTQIYNSKFEPAGQGTLIEDGIKALTEAKVISGEWCWRVQLKPGEIP